MHSRLLTRLNQGLQEGAGLSLADYDVLVALTDAADQSLRMGELGEQLHWEKSRLSKQLSRMAARGLVVRRECLEDRRGAYVDLTPAGRDAIETAAPDHVGAVRRMVFDQLSSREVAQLVATYDKVLSALDREADARASN